MVETPDEYEYHKVTRCSNCRENLDNVEVDKTSRRQVYDIPPLHIRVIEHQSEIKVCNCGCSNSNFPPEANHYVQYGPRIKGLMVYLHPDSYRDYQLLPYGRTSELIEAVSYTHLTLPTIA